MHPAGHAEAGECFGNDGAPSHSPIAISDPDIGAAVAVSHIGPIRASSISASSARANERGNSRRNLPIMGEG